MQKYLILSFVLILLSSCNNSNSINPNGNEYSVVRTIDGLQGQWKYIKMVGKLMINGIEKDTTEYFNNPNETHVMLFYNDSLYEFFSSSSLTCIDYSDSKLSQIDSAFSQSTSQNIYQALIDSDTLLLIRKNQNYEELYRIYLLRGICLVPDSVCGNVDPGPKAPAPHACN